MKNDRASNGGFARILVAVLLVAFLLPMSGCTGPGGSDEEKITLSLASPSVSKRDTEELWDADIAINKITPKDSTLKWSNIKVVIKDSFGSVLLPLTSVSQNTGTYGSTIEVWYIPLEAGASGVSPGEVIKLTGMDDGYEGAYVTIFNKDTQVGDSMLPTNFP